MNRSTTSISTSLVRLVFATFLITAVGLGLASEGRADQSEMDDAYVKYRQTVMEGIGNNMGAIGDILKNRLMLPGHVANHAQQLAESSELIAAAFKQKTQSTETDAKVEIWKDWTKFEAAIADFAAAAKDLQAAASGSDASAVGPAVKVLGKSCGGCHKSFRKPKEESFRKMKLDHDHQ
jgi:cytochrome c556